MVVLPTLALREIATINPLLLPTLSARGTRIPRLLSATSSFHTFEDSMKTNMNIKDQSFVVFPSGTRTDVDTIYISTTLTLTTYTITTETVTRVKTTSTAVSTTVIAKLGIVVTSVFDQQPTSSGKFIDMTVPDLDSNAGNKTMLVTAIFSHPAMIAWLSLFVAFLVFASVVFALQKVMRRIRAKRWIRQHEAALKATEGAEGNDGDGSAWSTKMVGGSRRGVGYVYGGQGCEFINGSDLSLRADDGVDGRSGSWSRRRDEKMKRGERKRKSPSKTETIQEEA
ncbi:hypothetical protein ABW20_dc0101900 [Dactylellina cionopaga]|nr:hypothetical protein ABW20_dc0101900 [Dactylellina cionopaga]